ncbi:MAG: GIY-YIG nuclease family protein [Candidatus Manganitrophaceae bacterium]|nr:MAG: GIY-YIG nuclease family protein [Candidatus Manganitrophaceae bacterium]
MRSCSDRRGSPTSPPTPSPPEHRSIPIFSFRRPSSRADEKAERRLTKKKAPSRSGIDPQRREGSPWTVYIVECGDGTLYTGITNDLARRLDQHNRGRASRYTRVRLPVVLVYQESVLTRSEALVREREIKSLSRREKKMVLISQ